MAIHVGFIGVNKRVEVKDADKDGTFVARVPVKPVFILLVEQVNPKRPTNTANRNPNPPK